VFNAKAQRQFPVFPGDVFRDQLPVAKLPSRSDSDNHQQREHDRRDENQQQQVRC
jgi:hypothetical protein